MFRNFGYGLVVLYVLFGMQGSAWAQSSQDLTDASVASIEVMQAKAEQRIAVLQTLTETSANAVDAKLTYEQDRPRVAEPRADEKSFARIPTRQTRSLDLFGEMLNEIDNIHSPSARLAVLENFVQDQPLHRDARLYLARELMLNDLPSRVLIALAPLTEPGHKRSHPDWQPWFWLGTAYLGLEQSNNARTALEVALSKTQIVGEIWLHLAVAEQLDDNHAGALQYLQIAQQLLPSSGRVELNKAYSHERLGDLRAARTAYQRFLVAEDTGLAHGTRPAIVRHLAVIGQSF